MFVPFPGSEENPPILQEADDDVGADIPILHHRPRWPWLLRLAMLFRVLAGLSLVLGLMISLAGFFFIVQGEPRGVFVAAASIASGVFNFIFCMGLSELVMLLIAIERNTRQTRNRAHKQRGETNVNEYKKHDLEIDVQ